MTSIIKNIKYKEQWLLYIFLNILFIWKYMSRTMFNPLIGIIFFILFCIFIVAIYYNIIKKNNKNLTKYFIICILLISCSLIGYILYKIDPLSVNVDRWSATSYFLDGLFNGVYPYGIHTHVCETNYPSPSPMWFYLNIPFWLLGDVGLGLIFFLLFITKMIYWFTNSYKNTLLFLLLLVISPAYWWEIIVRSDGLSNSFVIFSFILFFEKYKLSFQSQWIVTTILCGIMAATRLWAPIAPAIYLSKSFLKVSLIRKIYIILIILLIVFLFFVPYIFWDTQNWIFFSRNPFLSETSTGNKWILLIMIIIVLYISLKFHNFNQYCISTSCFFTLFFFVSLLFNHLINNSDIPIFEDPDFDISYFSLMLPYCLFTISKTFTDVNKKCN